MAIKAGDVYVPKSGSIRGGFTVIEVGPGEITVDVQRQTTSKDGELTMDTRKRVVPSDVLSFFLLGYDKARKDQARD